MKISVQFEADSAEEYDRVLEALTGPGRSMFHVKQSAIEPDPMSDPEYRKDYEAGKEAALRVLKAKADRTEKPAEIEPLTTPEPEPVKGTDEGIPAPVVPSEKPKRGRPKAPAPQPVTEAPVTVHAEPAKEPDPALADHVNGVSRKDLLDVFSEYVQRYGANFGYTDVSKLLQQHIGDGVRKASDVPDGALAAAIKAIKTAITENPFNRKVDYA